MDEPTLTAVRAHWPDVAAPFSRVVPDGLAVVRLLDHWSKGQGALRRRTLELSRAEGAPPMTELLEEAIEDAERRGWTRVDEACTRDQVVLELEGVLLRLGARKLLSASFDQPRPADAGPPVETSEVFQSLVRRLLGLAGEPRALSKEVRLDPHDLGRAVSLAEWVELPEDPEVYARAARVGFSPEGGADVSRWISREIQGAQALASAISSAAGMIRVELVKSRLEN